MKCDDVQELLAEYWDLPKGDLNRKKVDLHLRECRSCAEEFGIWQASKNMIADAAPASGFKQHSPSVHMDVMNRIYRDEAWRMPVANRSYAISDRFRRTAMGCIAFFLAVFLAALFHAFHGGGQTSTAAANVSGLMPTASVQSNSLNLGTAGSFEGIPVASITTPRMINVDQLPHSPNYWIAFSILGIIGTLLIMNWLSRIKS